MVQDREAVPSPAQSFGCALLVLMLLFFGRMAITQMPTTWQQIAVTVIAPQLGLVLFPVLLVATFFTTSIRTSLRVNAAPWLAFPTAILLAVLLHPAYVELAGLISHVYPLSEQAVKSLKEFDGLLGAPPFWQVCLVLAVIPALCEELCFRGFTMAGLLRMNRPYVAVAVTAFLFGMSHSILQQSLSATVMGLVIGVIAWRTGSVLPGILFHATHNSLSMWLGRLSSEQMTANRTELEGLWNYIARQTSEGVTYQPVWTLLSSALAIVTLYYFLTLRTKSSQTSSLGKSLSAAHSAFATPATR